MSKKTLVATAFVSALIGAAVSALVAPRVSEGAAPLGAYIRLYSEGVVVDSWDPAGPGYMDGNSYVFPVRRGPVLTDVRISGTFSVEGVKQTPGEK